MHLKMPKKLAVVGYSFKSHTQEAVDLCEFKGKCFYQNILSKNRILNKINRGEIMKELCGNRLE